jgi:hypothetical protein
VRWILSEIESDACAKAFNPPRQGLSTPA